MPRLPHAILMVALMMICDFGVLPVSEADQDRPCEEEARQLCKDIDGGQRHLLDQCLRKHEPQLSAACGERLRVSDILRQMSRYLGDTEQVTFRAEFTEEDVLDSGQKLQFEGVIQLLLRRPNKVRLDFRWARGDRRFWYDGAAISLHDRRGQVYATSKAPSTIDEALDFAQSHLGVTVPLADLLSQNPYDSLLPPAQGIQSAMYLGVEPVRGRPCHHLAVSLEHLDWQLWIDDGPLLVPRKLVLTYTKEPSHPQYTVVFTDWSLSPRLPDVLFRFMAPEAADKIEFLAMEKSTNPAEEVKR